MLQHTSGIPGTNSQGSGNNLDVVMESFLRGGPTHEPGTHWEYWNQGYSLLSETIARASGQSYTTYCKEHVFSRAGMDSTRFTGDDPPPGKSVAIGRSSHGPPRSALDHPYGSYGFQYRGMGGVVTNVWDLWRWDRALHGNDPLHDDAKKELFTPGLNDYALGWFVKRTKNGRLVQSHGGGVRGFVCEIRRYPEDDGCLFVLCNNDAVNVRRVSQAVEAILFGEQPPASAREGLLGDALRKGLTGRYSDERGNVITIEFDGPLTRTSIHWSPPSGPVTHAVLRESPGGDVLIDDGSGMDITMGIERDDEGVAHCLIILNRRYERLKE
jgi:CubicO group peptidase (beta-lactamase class C family)